MGSRYVSVVLAKFTNILRHTKSGRLGEPSLWIRAGFDGVGVGGYSAPTVSPVRNGGKETT